MSGGFAKRFHLLTPTRLDASPVIHDVRTGTNIEVGSVSDLCRVLNEMEERLARIEVFFTEEEQRR